MYHQSLKNQGYAESPCSPKGLEARLSPPCRLLPRIFMCVASVRACICRQEAASGGPPSRKHCGRWTAGWSLSRYTCRGFTHELGKYTIYRKSSSRNKKSSSRKCGNSCWSRTGCDGGVLIADGHALKWENTGALYYVMGQTAYG